MPINDPLVTHMSRTADPTTRISLLRAAEEIFARKGLDATKVEEIAKQAGVSKGAFYLHFETKEEIFLHVVEAFLARCGSMLRSPAAAHELPERAEDLVDCGVEETVELYEFLWQNRAIMAILQTCTGEHAYLLEAFRKDLHANTKAWIELFMARGLYRADLDPNLVATLLVGAHNELATAMLASEKKPPLRDWLLATHRFFYFGLSKNPGVVPTAPSSRVALPSLQSLPEASPSEPRGHRPKRPRTANAK